MGLECQVDFMLQAGQGAVVASQLGRGKTEFSSSTINPAAIFKVDSREKRMEMGSRKAKLGGGGQHFPNWVFL